MTAPIVRTDASDWAEDFDIFQKRWISIIL